MQTVADSSIKLYFPYTTRQKVGKCLPEIKKEISRKGVLNQLKKFYKSGKKKSKTRQQTKKPSSRIYRGVGFRYKLGCATRSLIHGCRRRELRPERVNLVEAFLFYRLSTSSAERTCKLGLK